MQTLPFEGHNVAYQCKGLNQSNIVCEFKVNLSTNEKVITENKTLTQIVKEQYWISRSSEGQGHDATCWRKGLDLSNIVCEYEVNPLRLTNHKVIQILNA